MKIKHYKYDCRRCGNQHILPVDIDKLTKDQIEGKKPINNDFICPDIATMYRVGNFTIDTTRNLLDLDINEQVKNETLMQLNRKWGELNFDDKLTRYRKIKYTLIGIPEEYFELINDILDSYVCAYYYPAMTSAGALGERILNRLILMTRKHFQNSRHDKKIFTRENIQDWDKAIDILSDWNIISVEVSTLFKKLKKYRNDAIHYTDQYNFENNACEAVQTLVSIIDKQFNYFNRKDLCWVFDVPGEIWVRTSVVNDPFVQEFILPHCWRLSPYDEPTAKPPVKASNVPLKPLTDEEFINLRKTRKING